MDQSKRTAILVGLLLCMGISTLMQTYFSGALPAISSGFESVSLYSWVHSSYILASSSVMILSGSLCRRFGNKKNFMLGSLIFGIGTAMAPFSRGMPHLVAARMIMGIGAGMVIPAVYGMIGEYFEKKKYSAVFAAFAVAQILFNALGSLAGGILPEAASWQTIFYILIPMEWIGFWLVYKNVPDTAGAVSAEPLHIRNHLMMIAAILLTALGTEQTGRNHLWILAVGIVLLLFVIRMDAKNGNVLLPQELKEDSLLRNLCFQIFVLGAFYYVCLAYLPGVIRFSMGLSSEFSGTVLAVFVVFMGIGSILGGILHVPGRIAVIAGWAACTVGGIGMLYSILFGAGMLGLGSGVLMSVLLGSTAARTTEHSAGVNSTAHLIRNFGGSIGTIVFQSSLEHPKEYYIRGIIFLSVSGTLAALAALKIRNLKNENEV